jgi:hypothetical protein
MSTPSQAIIRTPETRPPAFDAVIELVGLFALAIAIGAVYVGARRTRQNRPEEVVDKPAEDKPKKRRSTRG